MKPHNCDDCPTLARLADSTGEGWGETNGSAVADSSRPAETAQHAQAIARAWQPLAAPTAAAPRLPAPRMKCIMQGAELENDVR